MPKKGKKAKGSKIDENSFRKFFRQSSGTEDEKSDARYKSNELTPPELNEKKEATESEKRVSVIESLRRSEKQERKKLTSISLAADVHAALFKACGSANIHVSNYIEELIKKDLQL